MQEDRHNKFRRLYLRPGIQHVKIAQLMEVQKEEDDLASSMQVRRHKLRAAWKDVEESVSRQARVDLENSAKWTIVSFRLAFMHVAATAPAFQQLLRETWIHRPCSRRDPWSVIVYGDEIVPGNVLRPENHRKLFCWYATIKELGPQKTKHEICWIPLAVLRSGKMKEDTGGVSVATEVLLRETFVQDGLATEGGCLDLQAPGGGFVQLFSSWAALSQMLMATEPCGASKGLVESCLAHAASMWSTTSICQLRWRPLDL